MSTNINEQPQVIVSCEDPHATYLCYKGIRFIFHDDEYVGWCRPGQQNAEGRSEAQGDL